MLTDVAILEWMIVCNVKQLNQLHQHSMIMHGQMQHALHHLIQCLDGTSDILLSLLQLLT